MLIDLFTSISLTPPYNPSTDTFFFDVQFCPKGKELKTVFLLRAKSKHLTFDENDEVRVTHVGAKALKFPTRYWKQSISDVSLLGKSASTMTRSMFELGAFELDSSTNVFKSGQYDYTLDIGPKVTLRQSHAARWNEFVDKTQGGATLVPVDFA